MRRLLRINVRRNLPKRKRKEKKKETKEKKKETKKNQAWLPSGSYRSAIAKSN